MPFFRKKPIEARQFTGAKDCRELCEWMGVPHPPEAWGECIDELLVGTSEKTIVTASKGDWIVKGEDQGFSICKPDIFEKTYEEVS